MIKYAFIGGLFTPEIQKIIENTSKGVIQYAADTLQKCYLEGLMSNSVNVTLFNLPFVGSFPFLSKIFKFNNGNGILELNHKKINYYSVGFNNFLFYKNFSRYFNLKKCLIKWIKKKSR